MDTVLMSLPSNDINPDIATKLPSNSLNSNDVILNVEGRKRMRRPYERYMRQMMQQTAQKAVNDSKPQIYIDAAQTNKSRSFNNAKFLSVISIFCAVFLLAVFLLAVFAFDYLLAKNSNISLATYSVSASFVKDKVSANQVNATAIPKSSETQNEMQNTDGAIGMIKVKTMLSEDDFKRAAQNTLFRDSDSHDLESNSARFVVISQPTMDQQDFRVEAKNILYREEDK